MGNLKLKSCDICAAVTSKDDEEFHAQWHRELTARSDTAEVQRQIERDA